MECILIGLRAYFIQHMGSFNYGKIRTMGAVLVAVSIPIFTGQLEKARQATTAANLRSAYAEAAAAVLTYDGKTTTGSATVIPATAEGKTTYSVTVTGVDIESTSLNTDTSLPFSSDVTSFTKGKNQTATFSITEDGKATLKSVS